MFGETQDRKLNSTELTVGERVFKDTIKWGQVRISDGRGAGNSIFTNAGIGLDRIYVTKGNFAMVPNDILIHELTHVWQGTNDGLTGWGYKLNSLMHQGYHMARGHGRNAAYTYDATLLGVIPWGSFPAEEQAQIVEDWFTSGEQPTHPAYRYIYWCIRRLMFTQGIWLAPPAP
jgi:hypothetical protein